MEADLVVVGAGPAGIVVALEVASEGLDVLLVESGRERSNSAIQRLGDAAEWNEDLHAPMSMATRRQLGGASVIWGGRCVPYDPVDFTRRPFIVDSAWPVSYEELLAFFERACRWLVCGRAVFNAAMIPHLPTHLVPGLSDGHVRTANLERWSLPTDFAREYGRQLRESGRIRVITGLTCTQVIPRPYEPRVESLECRTLDGKELRMSGRMYVLACGGLESTRLLLASPGANGAPIGDHSSHLGRWYMGHVEGVVADVHFSTPPRQTIHDYERDIDGVYVRRRFSFSEKFQLQRELPNIVAWLANPDLPDSRHRSGALSLAYLALSSPLGAVFAPEAQRRSLTGEKVPGAPYGMAEGAPLWEHLRNVALDLPSTLRFAGSFGTRRFLLRSRRIPGFFAFSRRNIYPFQYHAEHIPTRESRVMLTSERDALGMPRLRIDMRFSDRDVEGVARAHRYWDAYLRHTGCGHLQYRYQDVGAAIWERIGGGFHQVGTTRMAADPRDGVVDPHLTVHGFSNLFVASSSTFLTSSQANSTFMIIVFALRLGDRLRSMLRRYRHGSRSLFASPAA